MSVLSIFKSKSVPPSHQRCHHHYDNGSRCRLPIDSASEHFCGRHLDTGQLNTSGPESEAANLALYREVMGGAKYLNSATAVNHVLDNLFRLTLLGRIPQRQASKLTTQLRASLTSIRMKRDEYRVSQDDIETLLSDIDSHRESLENETETEVGSPQVAATSTSGSSTNLNSNHQPRPARVAAGLACPEAQRGAQPGFAHPETSSVSARENCAEAQVAPHVYPELSGGDSLHRDGESGRTCAASFEPNQIANRGKDRAAPQPRQIELLRQEANRADRDPFFDFLPRTDSARGNQHAPLPNEAVPPDLPEFSELRAAESRRRVADLVNGVWIGPKPNEINWDQLEQQIALAEQINPTPFHRRRNRWWPAT